MSDAARDLGLLKAMAADLDQYLLSDVMFWSLSESGSIRQHRPQLTLGSLLFVQARLRVTGKQLSPESQTELSQLSQRVSAERSRWRANWLKKAEKEVETRVNSWGRAVQERSEADYPGQAQSRLMLDLVLQDSRGETGPAIGPLRDRLATQDTLMKGRFGPGKFTLDEDLKPAFPEPDYWYLYGRPVETR